MKIVEKLEKIRNSPEFTIIEFIVFGLAITTNIYMCIERDMLIFIILSIVILPAFITKGIQSFNYLFRK